MIHDLYFEMLKRRRGKYYPYEYLYGIAASTDNLKKIQIDKETGVITNITGECNLSGLKPYPQIRISDNGKYLAVTSAIGNGMLELFTNQNWPDLTIPDFSGISAKLGFVYYTRNFSFSPDNTMIALAGNDTSTSSGYVKIYDCATGTLLASSGGIAASAQIDIKWVNNSLLFGFVATKAGTPTGIFKVDFSGSTATITHLFSDATTLAFNNGTAGSAAIDLQNNRFFVACNGLSVMGVYDPVIPSIINNTLSGMGAAYNISFFLGGYNASDNLYRPDLRLLIGRSAANLVNILTIDSDTATTLIHTDTLGSLTGGSTIDMTDDRRWLAIGRSSSANNLSLYDCLNSYTNVTSSSNKPAASWSSVAFFHRSRV